MELDFLDEAQASEPVDAPAIVDVPEPAPEGPARDDQGRFAAPPEPESAPEPVAPAAEPVAATPEPTAPPGYVPLAGLLEERDRRQAAEAEAARYRAAQTPLQPQTIPDPYEDPEGYAAFHSQSVQSAIQAQNLHWSRQIAEVRHTPEAVAQAHEWGVAKCDSDPFFNQRVMASQDPYGLVMEEWKRDQLLTKFQPSDYDQFIAWKAAQGQAQGQVPITAAAVSAAPPVTAPTPPRSLASASSAAGKAPPDPGSAYDGIFEG